MADKEALTLADVLFEALFGGEDCQHKEALKKACILLGALALRQGGRIEFDVSELEDIQSSGKAVAIQHDSNLRRVTVQLRNVGQVAPTVVQAPSTDSKH